MSPFRETLDPEWYEKCARHTARHTARSLQFGFYCDECARRLTLETFNKRAPHFHGETQVGTCGLCNRERSVTLRAWFVCTLCWNVVLGYQKSLVASDHIRHFWKTRVHSELPGLVLRETEAIKLLPFARTASTKRQLALTLDVLDFLVEETLEGDPVPLFHIEQKSGPGAIDSMKEFQLDVNDYEDILGASRNTGLPAYIFHVQLGQEYARGTRRIVTHGMWWTNLGRLRQSLKAVRARRGDDKQAAYFRVDAFKPMEFFLTELREQRFRDMVDSIHSPELALPGR